MFCKISAIGRVGRDPDFKTSNNLLIGKFSLAVNKKNKDGTQETTWLNCVAFNSAAKIIKEFVSSGDKIYIAGELSINRYTDKNNIERDSVNVVVREITLIDTKRKELSNAENVEAEHKNIQEHSVNFEELKNYAKSDELPF